MEKNDTGRGGIIIKELSQGKWKVRVIRSSRKSLGLQIDESLCLTVRAPYGVPDAEIARVVSEKAAWIEKHMQQMAGRYSENERHPADVLTAEKIKQLADWASKYIPERVAFFAGQMKVCYGRITIRCQRTRWGSCSTKGNLNFNCLLMLAPQEVIDYVVVHELCHRLEMNHSAKFWRAVESILPDYRKPRQWLKENGNSIMRRIKRPPA